MSEIEEPVSLPDFGDDIDNETFGQVYAMDEDDDHEFSLEIVTEFFEQADDTFTKMDAALDEEDLEELSNLGHYLKGSSATLGLVKVKDSCEKIQRYGKMEELDGSPQPDEQLCLNRIKKAIEQVKVEYKRVERTLKEFYELPIDDDDDDPKEGEEEEDEDKKDEDAVPSEAEQEKGDKTMAKDADPKKSA